MKRVYIKPDIEVIELECEYALHSSFDTPEPENIEASDEYQGPGLVQT